MSGHQCKTSSNKRQDNVTKKSVQVHLANIEDQSIAVKSLAVTIATAALLSLGYTPIGMLGTAFTSLNVKLIHMRPIAGI